jgi:F0F1-type ATP synthase assembly protein I
MDAPGNGDKLGGFGTKWSSEFGPLLTLGLQLAISVVAFFFLGRWLDSKLDTAPWLMIVGLLLGVVGGFLNFLRTVTAIGKKEEKESRK